jgi:protein-S-isoprenylcysteine O-methyltransferase|tara:strand:- start:962 stop:1549 length:588 start_codon:yes stop_codon:yes gene_type:complete|mmetsp:Transcript_9428/g.27209  ORF Transcript_9428/g.27209 Transcript_9428/m.27209 type:complete len:196 (+) Transcript_9428:56-643(+)
MTFSASPPHFQTFLLFITFFHLSEFLIVFAYNRDLLNRHSWLFSVPYCCAMTFGLCEYYFMDYSATIPVGMKRYAYAIGVITCLIGECIRKWAEIYAKHNFTHVIQTEKREKHRLVTEGPYKIFRHPGYFGWLLWAPGTQLVLGNVVSVVVFVFVSWRFFYKRIPVEEYFLERMFGEETYGRYRQKTKTWIPGIP